MTPATKLNFNIQHRNIILVLPTLLIKIKKAYPIGQAFFIIVKKQLLVP